MDTSWQSMQWAETVAHLVGLRLRAQAEAVERLCEIMITTPDSPGIMVEGERAWLDQRVPFGEIWDVSACGEENVK